MKLILALVLIALTGCATGPKPPEFSREYSPVGAKGFFYDDKTIRVSYLPATVTSGIAISVENKTSKAMRIIWDESAFINGDGTSEKIIHDGVRLIDRNASAPATSIPPHAKIMDSITPTSRIAWTYNAWTQFPICGSMEFVQFQGMVTKDEDCMGKTFGIFLTYEIDGKKMTQTLRYAFSKRELKVVPAHSARETATIK